MTDHPCQHCGDPYAPYGFIGKDGIAVFYCRAHKEMGVAHPPEKGQKRDSVQNGFDFGPSPEGLDSFKKFLASGTYDYQTRLVGYIRHLPEDAIGTGEDFHEEAESWIGPPPNPNAVGAAVLEAVKRGLLEPTGRRVAPRGQRSHKSAKPEWRRTNIK